MKKIAILQFPASNCDRDLLKVFKKGDAEFISPLNRINISNYKAFLIPGGFSYGDYLRAGALAAKSPVMEDVLEASKKGMPILGICNGFQVLCEARLLDGSLLPNKEGRFVDGWTDLFVESESSFFPIKGSFSLPIAHGEGLYYADKETLKRLEDEEGVWIRYQKNPNGSIKDIAGIKNKKGNVCGLMPHPERAVSESLGGVKGLDFFEKLLS